MASEEHAADEAAGEVIYSSDGLPPFTIPKPRNSILAAGEEKTDDGDMTILDTGDGGMDATKAFEVFSGKVYPIKTAATTTSTAPSGGGAKSETPAERLSRLQREVAELEQDLNSGAVTTTEDGSSSPPAVMELVTDLKQRLQNQAGAAASSKNQAEMTRSIQQHLQEWEAKKGSGPDAAAAAAAASSSEAGIVYELYGGVGVVPPAASAAPSLEERLLQVEKMVGTSGGTSTGTSSKQSLLKRLEEMETFLKTLDSKGLEQASAKAKVIRSDLEAASKARNKLASAATFRKEDAKTISSLYDQMTQLEGLSDHLPALVARLQQLATLHSQSSTFSVRLTQSEKEVIQLQALVKQLETTVTKVETGMVDNVKVIEKNMQKLDERMNKL